MNMLENLLNSCFNLFCHSLHLIPDQVRHDVLTVIDEFRCFLCYHAGMKVTAIKTHKITAKDTNILTILDRYLPPKIKEKSIIVVTSKIVSICEGSLIKENDLVDFDKFIISHVDYYIPREKSRYRKLFTIINNNLIPNAGIDRSNADSHLVLWPKNPFDTAIKIHKHLKAKFRLKQLGVIITDSRTSLMRRGAVGFVLAYAGFKPTYSYIGQRDIFGRIFQVDTANIADSLATAATLAMGEGNQQQPLAIVEEVPTITFIDRKPTRKEINEFILPIEDDIFAIFLTKAHWRKGGGGK